MSAITTFKGRKNVETHLKKCRLVSRSRTDHSPTVALIGRPLYVSEYRTCIVRVAETINVRFRDVKNGLPR